ncbi:MAG TPA: hypothetical protein VFD84_04615 [Candidatus Binatia bacterium]|nr:hypothetical protein [Candidatus Binatia bacterium]
MHTTRSPFLALALALALAGTASAKKPPFAATTLAGTWTGTWKEITFHVGGPFTVVISAADADTITVDGTSADFGCGGLATPVVLKRGVDWTETGGTGTFDTITLTFRQKNGKVKGTGSNCHGTTWKLKGRVRGNKFTGRSVTKTFSGKSGISTLKATRTP